VSGPAAKRVRRLTAFFCRVDGQPLLDQVRTDLEAHHLHRHRNRDTQDVQLHPILHRVGQCQPAHAHTEVGAAHRPHVGHCYPPMRLGAAAGIEPTQPVHIEHAVVLAAAFQQATDVGHHGALPGTVDTGDQHGLSISRPRHATCLTAPTPAPSSRRRHGKIVRDGNSSQLRHHKDELWCSMCASPRRCYAQCCSVRPTRPAHALHQAELVCRSMTYTYQSPRRIESCQPASSLSITFAAM
jgi:hypothetical protein